MITDEDIKRITDAQIKAQQVIFYTKTEMDAKFATIEEMRQGFNSLQMSMDAIITNNKIKNEEQPITTAE